jgi:hypothetical protein
MNGFVYRLRYATGFVSSESRFAIHKVVCAFQNIRKIDVIGRATRLCRVSKNSPKLNAELKTTVARIDHFRCEIDAIVAEIEGEEVEA